MKVLITGGHLTPALALIDYLQANHPTTEIVFAGRIVTQRSTKQQAKEKEEVEKRSVTFIAFDSGKLVVGNPIALLVNSVLFLKALVTASSIILRHQPTVYVSFGSYVSIPMALVAWVLRVPIVLHEQTRTAGIANATLSSLASAIAISHQESSSFFPATKTHFTGNLIRRSVLTPNATRPSWFTTKATKPIIYITGGSQGSEVINTTTARVIKQLTKEWIVIHQCGSKTEKRNYKKELDRTRNRLSRLFKQHYIVREWISESELAWIYAHARLAISRAGANTITELQLRAIPSILIPLPFSHNNEQYLNAKALADRKQALLISQKELTPTRLLEAISEAETHHAKMKKNLLAEPLPLGAEEKLFEILKRTSN